MSNQWVAKRNNFSSTNIITRNILFSLKFAVSFLVLFSVFPISYHHSPSIVPTLHLPVLHLYRWFTGVKTRLARRTTLWNRWGSCRLRCLSCRRTSIQRNWPGTRLRNSRGTWVKSLRPLRPNWRTPLIQPLPSRNWGAVLIYIYIIDWGAFSRWYYYYYYYYEVNRNVKTFLCPCSL